METWIIVSILLTLVALVALIFAIKLGLAKSADQADYEEDIAENGEDDEMAEFHRAEQSKLRTGLIAAVIIAVIFTIGAGISWANPGFFGSPEEANAQQAQSESANESVEKATEEATEHLAATVNEAAENQKKANETSTTADNLNIVQANAVFPIGERILMSQESLPTNYAALVEATGISDATALPHSTAEANQAVALQDLMKECYDEPASSTNTPYVLGTLSFFREAYNVWFGCEPDMPELIRLTDLYRSEGIEPFVLTNAEDKFVLTADGQQWYVNDDAKIAAAMYKALYDEMVYSGVEDHDTLMNYHSNCGLAITDHRIEANPVQYQGKFHVWNLVWKGQNLFQFGTNCGSAEGPGDKRPALFAQPTTEEAAPSTGGGSPNTGGGGNPPTGTGGGSTPPTGDNDDPPAGHQNVKDPSKDPVNKGNAPVGGGKNDDPGPGAFERDDHSATSTGASPDAGNDDGSSRPSNQVQDPSAAQDNSTPPKLEEIPVTHDTTVTDNETGQTTNTGNEKPNKGKVDPD